MDGCDGPHASVGLVWVRGAVVNGRWGRRAIGVLRSFSRWGGALPARAVRSRTSRTTSRASSAPPAQPNSQSPWKPPLLQLFPAACSSGSGVQGNLCVDSQDADRLWSEACRAQDGRKGGRKGERKGRAPSQAQLSSFFSLLRRGLIWKWKERVASSDTLCRGIGRRSRSPAWRTRSASRSGSPSERTTSREQDRPRSPSVSRTASVPKNLSSSLLSYNLYRP